MSKVPRTQNDPVAGYLRYTCSNASKSTTNRRCRSMNGDGGSSSYVAASCAIWPSIAPVGTSKCRANCSTQSARTPRSGVRLMGTSSTYPCWTGANCLLTAMASTTGGASLKIPTASRQTFTRRAGRRVHLADHENQTLPRQVRRTSRPRADDAPARIGRGERSYRSSSTNVLCSRQAGTEIGRVNPPRPKNWSKDLRRRFGRLKASTLRR